MGYLGDRIPCWPYSFASREPTFTVTNWAAAKPLMAAWLEAARAERGLMFCGWTISGDKLACREACPDADFLIAHAQKVSPMLEKLLAGTATLDRMCIHAPAGDVDRCAEAMQCDVQPFEILTGVTRLVRPYAGSAHRHLEAAPSADA